MNKEYPLNQKYSKGCELHNFNNPSHVFRLACNFSANITLKAWTSATSSHITHLWSNHWDWVKEVQLETASKDKSLCFPRVNIIFFVALV